MIAVLPRRGETLPAGLNPSTDICPDCGDFIAWCPIWVRRWPHLEEFRE